MEATGKGKGYEMKGVWNLHLQIFLNLQFTLAYFDTKTSQKLHSIQEQERSPRHIGFEPTTIPP